MEPNPALMSHLVSSKAILVVDDDPDILDALTEILAGEGFEVIRARNGLEALERFSVRTPDLILLDLMMPVMDGWQFADRMRQNSKWGQVPIVVLSADRNVSARAREIGALSYLSKPFELAALLSIVYRALKLPWDSRPSGNGPLDA